MNLTNLTCIGRPSIHLVASSSLSMKFQLEELFNKFFPDTLNYFNTTMKGIVFYNDVSLTDSFLKLFDSLILNGKTLNIHLSVHRRNYSVIYLTSFLS